MNTNRTLTTPKKRQTSPANSNIKRVGSATPSKLNPVAPTEIFEEINSIKVNASSRAIVLLKNNNLLWCGNKDGYIHVIDYESGVIQQKIEGPIYSGEKQKAKLDVSCLAVVGDKIWSGSADGVIRVFALSGEQEQEMSGHTATVTNIHFASTIKKVFTCSQDWTIRVYHSSGQFYKQLLGHTSWVRVLYYDNIQNRLWSGGDEPNLRLWNEETGESTEISGHSKGIHCLTATPDGEKICSGSEDTTVRVWNLDGSAATIDNDKAAVLEGHMGWVISMATAGDLLLTGGADKTIRIWEIASAKCLKIIQQNGYVGLIMRFSDKIVTCTSDNTVHLYAIASAKLMERIRKYEESREIEKRDKMQHDTQKLIYELREEIKRLEQKIRNLEEEKSQLLSRLAQNKQDLEKTKEMNTDELSDYQQLIILQKTKVKKLEEEIEAMKAHEQQLNDRLKASFKEAENVNNQNESLLRETREHLESEIGNLKQQIEIERTNSMELSKEHGEEKELLNKKIEELQLSLVSVGKDKTLETKEMEELSKTEINKLLKQLDEERTAKYALSAQMAALQNIFTETTQKNAEMEQKLNLVSASFDSEVTRLKEELRQLKEEKEKESILQRDLFNEQHQQIIASIHKQLDTCKDNLEETQKILNILVAWILEEEGRNNQKSIEDIKKIGFMMKKGEVVKNWKRRLFMLRSNGLINYYDHKNKPKPKGIIDVSNAIRVKVIYESTDILPMNSILIQTSNRIWELHCESREEAEAWAQTIRDFIPKQP